MRNLLIFTFISVFGAISQSDNSTYVILDGSVASCASKEDINNKAFRIKAVVDTKGLQFIKIENLICNETAKASVKSFGWAQKALNTETSLNTDLGVMKSLVSKAVLQIADFEGYIELQQIKLDVDLAEQTVLLSGKVTNLNKVVAVLSTYQKTTLNDVVQDEGYNSSGHFVIKIK